MKLILFDVDGTLVDSLAIIHECMRRTFVDFGIEEPTQAHSKSIVGLSLSLAIATMLNEAESPKTLDMAEHYKRIYLKTHQIPQFSSSLFPGVSEMVHSLHSVPHGLLGLVTGKAQRGVDNLLDTYGFRNHFVTTRCADDCPSKPHPAMVEECCAEVGIDPKDTWVIGDTTFDIEMAKSAGAGAIGVAWGNHENQLLMDAGADKLVHTMQELQSTLQNELQLAAV